MAIFLGIKDPKHSGPCDVLYRDIGDYLSREEKLRIVGDGYLDTVEWQTVTPNLHGDWSTNATTRSARGRLSATEGCS